MEALSSMPNFGKKISVEDLCRGRARHRSSRGLECTVALSGREAAKCYEISSRGGAEHPGIFAAEL